MAPDSSVASATGATQPAPVPSNVGPCSCNKEYAPGRIIRSSEAAPTSSSTSSTTGGTWNANNGAASEDAQSGGCQAAATCQATQQQTQGTFVRCEVPHIPQRFSWDCGIACVLMVLRALGVGWQRARYKDLLRLCPTTSVWTIDLAHLLALFRVRVTFLTITIGADHSYANEAFYAPQWGSDAARVQRLFDAAPAAGVRVAQQSVSCDELRRLVGGGTHLAVVLVDKRITDPTYAAWCEEQQERLQHQHQQQQQAGGRGQQEQPPAGGAGTAGICGSGGGTGSCTGAGTVSTWAWGLGSWQVYQSNRTWQAYFESYYHYSLGRGASSFSSAGPGGNQRRPVLQLIEGPCTQEADRMQVERDESNNNSEDERQQQKRQQQQQQQAAASGGWSAYYTWWLNQGSPSPPKRLPAAPRQDGGGAGDGDPAGGGAAAAAAAASASGYAGHYLVLVGHDVTLDEFLVQDPAHHSGPSRLAAGTLERGRRAFGTDEDLLLIEMPAAAV